MARKPSPWYREDRNGWYVTLDGQRHFLGEHPPGAPRPKKSEKTGRWNAPSSIEDAFVRLQSGEGKATGPDASEDAGGDAAADDNSVFAVLDDFITWCKENREAVTANRYEEFCQDFCSAAGPDGARFGDLGVERLTSKHVTAWLGQKETWGPTTRKNAITALMAGFNWAVLNRGLVRNPIKGMKKPEARRRSDVVAPGEFEEMLDMIGDLQLRDLLTVSYDCGGRPFEVKELEKRHLQLEKQRAVIPADEAKGRKHTRTIYLPTARSMTIVRRLAQEYPTGPIFRNSRGNAWTADAVKCRFEDLEIEFGLEEMKRRGIELDTSEESIAAMIA